MREGFKTKRMQCLREVGVIGKPQANDLFHDLFHGVTLRTGSSALRYTPAFLPAQSDPSTAALSLSQVRNSPVRMGSDSQQASGLQLVKALERQQGHFMGTVGNSLLPHVQALCWRSPLSWGGLESNLTQQAAEDKGNTNQCSEAAGIPVWIKTHWAF